MRSIDIHAHLFPQCFWNTVNSGKDWYGVTLQTCNGPEATISDGKRDPLTMPKHKFTPEERLGDMDQQGVDVQVVSIATPLFSYHLPADQGLKLAREVNDEIASMTRQWPQRFAGLATLPVQDVGASVQELERAVNTLGLKGAELSTNS